MKIIVLGMISCRSIYSAIHASKPPLSFAFKISQAKERSSVTGIAMPNLRLTEIVLADMSRQRTVNNYLNIKWQQLDILAQGLVDFPLLDILVDYHVDVKQLQLLIGAQFLHLSVRVNHCRQSYAEKLWPSDLVPPWYMEHFVHPPNHPDHGLDPEQVKRRLWCRKCLEVQIQQLD